jgi:hypothetical protein
MRQGARLTVSVCAIAAVCLAAGCGRKYQRVEDSYAQPINCNSARADIEWLQGNKVDKATEAAEGAKFALPTTIILGTITGTAGAQYEVGTGEYNRKIDERIANIKETCNLQ